VVECFNEFDSASVKSQIEEGGIKYKCLKKLINMIAWVQHTLQGDELRFDLAGAVSILAKIQEDEIMKKMWDESKLVVVADPTGQDEGSHLMARQPSYIQS